MEGQTNCVLFYYKSRNIGSLKQHMESKHNVFNMTIVQVLTLQVERSTDLESELKAKGQLIKEAEVDLNVIKEALEESLEEKERAFGDIITSQKKKTVEETRLVEEPKSTKEILSKAYNDLEIKTSALYEELKKVPQVSTQIVSERKEVATLTISKINDEVLNVKKE